MKFILDTAETLNVSDREIAYLLARVYVDAGFTSAETAASIFEPSAVRKRGRLIAAREQQSSMFAGMVIVVYPDSPARRLADGEDETEMHLLGVMPEYRGHGLGHRLVEAAMAAARQAGYAKMLLATQPTMHAAHKLYEQTGFLRIPNKDFRRNEYEFLAYQARLNS